MRLQAGRRHHAAPGPLWSAVEYTSTHPHDVRLRRAWRMRQRRLSAAQRGGDRKMVQSGRVFQARKTLKIATAITRPRAQVPLAA